MLQDLGPKKGPKWVDSGSSDPSGGVRSGVLRPRSTANQAQPVQIRGPGTPDSLQIGLKWVKSGVLRPWIPCKSRANRVTRPSETPKSTDFRGLGSIRGVKTYVKPSILVIYRWSNNAIPYHARARRYI